MFNEFECYFSLHAEAQSVEPALDEQLRAFWELEALGIKDEERTVYDEFTGAIKFENGRYKVPLPWRELHDPLPDNYLKEYDRTI